MSFPVPLPFKGIFIRVIKPVPDLDLYDDFPFCRFK